VTKGLARLLLAHAASDMQDAMHVLVALRSCQQCWSCMCSAGQSSRCLASCKKPARVLHPARSLQEG
jgi:hypothetical protein